MSPCSPFWGLALMVKQRAGERKRRRRKAAKLDINAASFDLYAHFPAASAGRRLAPPTVLLLGPGAFFAGLVFAAPHHVFVLGVSVLYLFIAAISLTRIGGAFLAPRPAPRLLLTDDELPVISVIVALYRERKVVAGLCASLQRFDYPPEKLDVLLVLEADDDATLAAARPAARRAGFKLLIAPPGEPRTKPRALNYALQAACGELIAVYDAEDAPSRTQLRAAAESFAADHRLGVVQAPLGWYNKHENWLTRQFALEYAAQFHALLPLFARLGAPIPLGGTSNVVRRTALEGCGGWDPFNVTEDADLGFRLARFGWKAAVITPGTGEEAPLDLRSWVGQRSRWLKGHLITWLVQMRRPRTLYEATGWRGVLALQLSLLANVFSALGQAPGLVLWTVGGCAIALGQAGVLAAAGVALGVIAWLAALASLLAGARRAGIKVRWLDLLSVHLYWLCQLPAAWRALKEMGGRAYVWVKTRHGVSSTRREAPDDIADDPDLDGRERRAVRSDRLARKPAE